MCVFSFQLADHDIRVVRGKNKRTWHVSKAEMCLWLCSRCSNVAHYYI